MGKGKRIREKRRKPIEKQHVTASGGLSGFRLPDTPENRLLIEEITGLPAEQFADRHGMLDSSPAKRTQKITAISSH